MESIIINSLGALGVLALSAILLPLFELIKYSVTLRSIEKNKSIMDSAYTTLSKAISELDGESSKRIELAIDRFAFEIKSVRTKEKGKDSKTIHQLLKQFQDVSSNLEKSEHLDEKVAIALPIIPLLLNYE